MTSWWIRWDDAVNQIMNIRDGADCIELYCVEMVPATVPCAGDVRLRVQVVCGMFSGGYDQIWIDAAVFRYFVEQLRQLDKVRRGTARLESVSPDEFVIEVTVVDEARHTALVGHLSPYWFDFANRPHRQRVEFAIRFCPSLLPSIVAEFEAMLAS